MTIKRRSKLGHGPDPARIAKTLSRRHSSPWRSVEILKRLIYAEVLKCDEKLDKNGDCRCSRYTYDLLAEVIEYLENESV